MPYTEKSNVTAAIVGHPPDIFPRTFPPLLPVDISPLDIPPGVAHFPHANCVTIYTNHTIYELTRKEQNSSKKLNSKLKLKKFTNSTGGNECHTQEKVM